MISTLSDSALKSVVCALAAFSMANSSAAVIGVTEVPLNGLVDDVRSIETNLGNLIADSLSWQATQAGLTPTVSFINGGGIRNNAIDFPGATPASPSDLDNLFVFETLPFGNKVVVIEDVTVATLLSALENSVSQVVSPAPMATGRFLQISGFRFSWDTEAAAAGSRIIDVVLNDGTALVDDGAVVSSLLLDIATNNFVATGGDFYSMFPGTFVDSGFVDEDALTNFIATGLAGRVRASDYPLGGNDRIFRDAQLAAAIPEPATVLLLALGLAGLGWSRGKQLHSTKKSSVAKS